MFDFQNIEIKKTQLNQEERKMLAIKAFDDACSIDEAINQKKEQDRLDKESFKKVWKNYRLTSKSIRNNLIILKITKLRINLLRIVGLIFNNGLTEVIDYINKINDDVSQQYIDEKKLLVQIKKSIKKLQSSKTTDCNDEILKLLAYIYLRNEILLNSFSEDLDRCRLSLRGIDCYLSDKNKVYLAHTDENINDAILQLGLKQKQN